MLRTHYIMINLRYVCRSYGDMNSYHSDVCKVHVISPDTISFVPSVVEALVGHVISLPVMMGVHFGE